MPPPLLAPLLLLAAAAAAQAAAGAAVEPLQLAALRELGFSSGDPCSGADNARAVTCDAASPLRHVTAVTLDDPRGRRFFSSVALSRLTNLTGLAVSGVPVLAAGGLAVIISHMYSLTSLAITNANLSGVLPHHWHCPGLHSLDLAGNHIRGGLPDTLAKLTELGTLCLANNSISGAIPSSLQSNTGLTLLDLSGNRLAGAIPDAIGKLTALTNVSLSRNSLSGPIPSAMSALTGLVHLDLGSNRLNGTIPAFLSKLESLRVLNLENNDFQGVIPFDAAFISRLQVFKIAGNSQLCYNRTQLPAKWIAIAPCDKNGLPVPPPHGRLARTDDGTRKDKKPGGDHGGPAEEVRRQRPNAALIGVAAAVSCAVLLGALFVCLGRMRRR